MAREEKHELVLIVETLQRLRVPSRCMAIKKQDDGFMLFVQGTDKMLAEISAETGCRAKFPDAPVLAQFGIQIGQCASTVELVRETLAGAFPATGEAFESVPT
jgi:hypothetical protein